MKTKSLILLAGVLATLAPQPARAAIWDGGLSHANFTLNDLWSTPNNWQDAVPTSSTLTDVVFVQSGNWTTATQNLAPLFTLRSLTFSSGSNVTAVTGNQLSIALGGNIAQNSAVAAVVSNAIIWNSNGLVTGSGTGRLSLTSTMSGSSSVRFRGTAGSSGLAVTVGGGNTFNGGALIGDSASAGPVDVTFNSNAAPGTGAITFFNGNIIRGGNGPRSFANPLIFSLNANGLAPVFTFGNGDTLAFKGPISVGGISNTFQVDNSLTTFDGDISGTTPLVKNGTGMLTLNGSNSAATGGWTINAGILKLGSSVALPTTTVTVNAAGTLDTSGQTSVALTSLNGTGNVRIGTSALTLGNGNASGAHSGSITGSTAADGTVKKIGTGTVAIGGAGSSYKSLTLENGTMALNNGATQLSTGLTVGGTLTASPTFNLNSGAVLTCDPNAGSIVSGPAGTNMVVDGAATRWNSGFQVVIGAGFGPGASAGLLRFRNSATLAGTFVLVGAGNSNETGTFIVESGAKVTSQAGVVGFVTGSIGAATVTGSGSLWANPVSLGLGGFSGAQLGGTGTLTVADFGAVTVDGPTTFWTAGNKIDVKGGTFTTDKLVTNGLTDATVAVSDPDESTSALTIGANGGDFTYPGAITNSTTGPGSLRKSGAGTATLTGTLTYTGFTRVTAGRLIVPVSYPFATVTIVSAGATLETGGIWGTNTFSQTIISPGGRLNPGGIMKGSLTNNGTLEVAAGRTFTTTGTVTNNGLMRFKTGAAFTASGPLVNNGTIDIITAGSFTPPPGFVNNGRIVDRTSVITSITKVDTLVTIGSQRLYAGHLYTLQAADAIDAPFTSIGVPFLLNGDQPVSTDLGEIVPQRFYRWKVD